MIKLKQTFYLILLLTISLSVQARNVESIAQTYQLTENAPFRNTPRGALVGIFDAEQRFTSTETNGNWIKITGHFPDDKWQPLEKPLWVHKYFTEKFHPVPEPKKSKRPEGSKRLISINKSLFSLKVIEKLQNNEKVIYQTRVALGMDGCLPQEKGGKCYYTEAGEYNIRWKVEDERGIEWCIPKSMEQEYPQDIAEGNRCFRGPIGKYALNIGGTYAIHGTSDPSSIGKKVSHGCIRTINRDMQQIYSLMDVGDKVVIID